MGVWSYEPFGNDTACDWSFSLIQSKDMSVIESALDRVIIDAERKGAVVGEGQMISQTIEPWDAERAIAAAAVVAKLAGHAVQTDSYTEAVDQWVATMPLHASPALRAKARHSLDVILAQTEDAEWQTALHDLRTLLSLMVC